MSTDALAYTMTNDTITLVIEGVSNTVRRGAHNFDAVRKAIFDGLWEDAKKMISPGRAIESWSRGGFVFTDNALNYKGAEIPEDLHDRIFKTARTGKDPSGLMNFWERLTKNPSKRSLEQLYTFLQHTGIPIDEEGFFLAYKGVRADWKDVHSGTFTNTPGAVMEMERNQISDDPRVHCAEGFHVGALAYAKPFAGTGGRTVICRVDPADVVSVPYDHSAQKVRVRKYTVVGIYGIDMPDSQIDEEDLPDLDPEEPDERENSKDFDPEEDEDLEEEDDESEEEEEPEEDWDDEDLVSEEEDDESEEYVPGAENGEEQENEGVEVRPSVAPPTPTVGQKIKNGLKSMEELLAMKLDDLRIYAKGEGVKNVKAVPGGRLGLIEKLTGVSPPDERRPGQFQVKSPAPPKGTKTFEELQGMTIEELRKYASSVLKIVGAYKIPGGKVVLLERCKEVLS